VSKPGLDNRYSEEQLKAVQRFTGGMGRSPELTILAAATVIACEPCQVPIVFLLAGHTETNARKSLAPCLRNLIPAFRAMGQGGSARQLALRPLDSVLYRRVDLILHRAVSGPTCSHAFPLHGTFRHYLYIDSSGYFASKRHARCFMSTDAFPPSIPLANERNTLIILTMLGDVMRLSMRQGAIAQSRNKSLGLTLVMIEPGAILRSRWLQD
jgi:hypothetical protein